MVSTQVRKWIGLPICFSNIGLYDNRTLSILSFGEYKSAKTRLDVMHTEIPCVKYASPTLAKGKKLDPETAVAEARAAFTHQNIVGTSTIWQRGLGLRITTHLYALELSIKLNKTAGRGGKVWSVLKSLGAGCGSWKQKG